MQVGVKHLFIAGDDSFKFSEVSLLAGKRGEKII